MQSVTLDEMRSDLSRLVERAARGEPFVIVADGRPVAKVVPLDDAAAPATRRRTGFLAGRILVPDDFDRMGAESIAASFDGGR